MVNGDEAHMRTASMFTMRRTRAWQEGGGPTIEWKQNKGEQGADAEGGEAEGAEAGGVGGAVGASRAAALWRTFRWSWRRGMGERRARDLPPHDLLHSQLLSKWGGGSSRHVR